MSKTPPLFDDEDEAEYLEWEEKKVIHKRKMSDAWLPWDERGRASPEEEEKEKEGFTRQEHWAYEDEQMKWALAESLPGVRVTELDQEMEDMSRAMALSVRDLPLDEYDGGREAYELSCKEFSLPPYGIPMSPVYLTLLHERSYLNTRCPVCHMNRIHPCIHFFRDDFAIFVRLRLVCKQWRACIDDWISRVQIKKTSFPCRRCQGSHSSLHGKSGGPSVLSNGYVIGCQEFQCIYPLHGKYR